MKKVKVLVVDDSAFVRELLTRCLSADPLIEVVGTASNSYIAKTKISELHPDVITLDQEMPGLNGIDFLKKLMKESPIPVLMVSAFTAKGSRLTIDALHAGAVDFVCKPMRDIERGLNGLVSEIQSKVKMAAKVTLKPAQFDTAPVKAPVVHGPALSVNHRCSVIAIGASTGGTVALTKVLENLSVNSPCILVVQHMPVGFTAAFAERLNSQLPFEVKEAKSGDEIQNGRVLLAPGGQHMELVRNQNKAWVTCNRKPEYKGLRPSVDLLFRSVARYEKHNAIGVLLTGMGDDGAEAMLSMRSAGARTIAQDEQSSVVFGMPRKAYELGAAEELVALDQIAAKINHYLGEMSI
ncbi:MAG: chemotaxis response regulator protein-glutamate methylesterase [Calditrichaeota bacterium]|nr:chemotaxis response regulator protein-glutamate methylesterase [Calditrichota bacterium]